MRCQQGIPFRRHKYAVSAVTVKPCDALPGLLPDLRRRTEELNPELYIDRVGDTDYSDGMKTSVSLLLIVLACMALMPASPVLFLVDRDCEQAFGNLDVCHSGVPAIATGGEMPCVNDCCGMQTPSFIHVSTELHHQLLTHFILSSRNERPPKA